MTRNQALEILDTIPTIGEQVDALEMAIESLQKEPKWIPVSEGLPEAQKNGDKDFSDWLLITIDLGKDNGTYVGEAYYCFSEKKWYAKRFVTGDVVAWMSLPKPYEPQESEDKE